MIQLHNGDCLDLMREIPDKSIDFILCDLPYGITDCKWDSVIPLEQLWEQYRRVIKPYGTIALFSAQPFTTRLIYSNLPNYKYSWYWQKNNKTGFVFAKYQPMRCVENIDIFRFDNAGNAGCFEKTREYLQSERIKSGCTLTEIKKLLNIHMASHYFTGGKQFSFPSESAYIKLQQTGCFKMPYSDLKALLTKSKQTFTYNPQGLKKLEKTKAQNGRNSNVYGMKRRAYVQEYTGYPSHLLKFDNEASNNKERYHPTQKPVALLEYLIKTYTHAGETVLDNCMGSGSTGIACINTNRRFVGMELDREIYKTAQERIEKHLKEMEGHDDYGQLSIFGEHQVAAGIDRSISG